ncbi:rhomboid family intramembrane serine protease [Butyrivibrio sp. AE3004]|uniref:rhomboid family intramembrane serine protease n=1 Tax=Butyrivibrio sp. AE3004 TaxID=1506994 RepID=UPI00049468DB|nr:rhomboid family intramembrane serine protease [Butyrivibrio sp. AE3004]
MNGNLDILSYPVTYGIIGINIIVFLLINMKKLDTYALGSSYINTVQEKQYYRVITSAFTQKEFLHLICNMYSLYNIGRILEHALKSRLYAACYVLIMLAGGYISARIHKKSSPFTVSIGASGVICGLLGIYMVIAFSVMGLSGLRSMIPTIVVLALMTTSKKIDSIGHFTGLAVGIICGVVLVILYPFV